MEEKYEIRFSLIEKWVKENPDEELVPPLTLLMKRARQNETEVENAWKAICALARGLEDWPICHCGRHHPGE